MRDWDDALLPAARRTTRPHYGGPERLFGVSELSLDGPVASGVIDVDARHVTSAGTGGGALGVLVDDVLGYAVVAACPVERWSVSTDITVDLICPPRVGTRLVAEARALYADEDASFAQCRVCDDAGRLVAVAAQRGRFTERAPDVVWAEEAGRARTPRDGSADRRVWQGAGDPSSSGGIAALLGAQLAGGGPHGVVASEGVSVAELRARSELCNPLGALHGGVALAASLIAAEDALRRLGAAGLAATSIRITYPRSIPTGADVAFTARARHGGRSFAVLDVAGEVDGRLCTSAQVTAHPLTV